jgi:hypothetical protein
MHHHVLNGNHFQSIEISLIVLISSIVSPSNYEKKRELTDRKDSITDDLRTNIGGLNVKKSGIDGTSKPPVLKSSSSFFLFDYSH